MKNVNEWWPPLTKTIHSNNHTFLRHQHRMVLNRSSKWALTLVSADGRTDCVGFCGVWSWWIVINCIFDDSLEIDTQLESKWWLTGVSFWICLVTPCGDLRYPMHPKRVTRNNPEYWKLLPPNSSTPRQSCGWSLTIWHNAIPEMDSRKTKKSVKDLHQSRWRRELLVTTGSQRTHQPALWKRVGIYVILSHCS